MVNMLMPSQTVNIGLCHNIIDSPPLLLLNLCIRQVALPEAAQHKHDYEAD